MPGRFDVLREPEREPERGPSRGRGRDRERSPESPGPGEPTLSEVMAWMDVLMAHFPGLATKNDISSLGAHFEAEFKGVNQDIKQLQSDRDDVRSRLAWAETQNAALRAQLQQANDRDSWDTYRARGQIVVKVDSGTTLQDVQKALFSFSLTPTSQRAMPPGQQALFALVFSSPADAERARQYLRNGSGLAVFVRMMLTRREQDFHQHVTVCLAEMLKELGRYAVNIDGTTLWVRNPARPAAPAKLETRSFTTGTLHASLADPRLVSFLAQLATPPAAGGPAGGRGGGQPGGRPKQQQPGQTAPGAAGAQQPRPAAAAQGAAAGAATATATAATAEAAAAAWSSCACGARTPLASGATTAPPPPAAPSRRRPCCTPTPARRMRTIAQSGTLASTTPTCFWMAASGGMTRFPSLLTCLLLSRCPASGPWPACGSARPPSKPTCSWG
jgi:hypothetical protein